MDKNSEILLAHILQNTRVAALATLRDTQPRISMVAYAVAPDFSAFYIHVSRLAQHTLDMQKNKYVGLMISETDDGRADPQTLARLSVRGAAEFLPSGEPGYTPIKDLYLSRFPESLPLFNLEDFSLWRIVPKGARYVAGFAKAFNLTLESLHKAAQR
ncbi:MAG: pyridoxamine 5'-phosphate oxidase family protein [Anaerolineales bacterium]|nr:pyridoxamine 5'-phosphate oxidase family protein [Anaerolineales bacterium]